MKNYSGPCYSMSEAADLLHLRPTELRHGIDNGALEAVVYTKPRKFLLAQFDDERKMIGVASCHYRGHLLLHSSYIQTLLDGDEIQIGKSGTRILNSSGISSLSTEYPFKIRHDLFSSWLNVKEAEVLDKITNLAAIPFPQEYEPPASVIQKQAQKLTAVSESAKEFVARLNKHEGPEYILNFQKNSAFSPHDLRIPSSEINRFTAEKSLQDKQEELHKSARTKAGSTSDSKENQLHSLIERILTNHPDTSAKEIWRIIDLDYQEDVPAYDTDQIIQVMDSVCIQWRSRHGIEQQLLWDSFPSLISRLKKKLKNIQ